MPYDPHSSAGYFRQAQTPGVTKKESLARTDITKLSGLDI